MADIIQFIPRVECDAKANLQGFIALCRDELTVLGADLDWNSNYWNVTKYLERKGTKGPFAFIFNNYDSAGIKLRSATEAVPMAQPFLDFAKSYMRYQHAWKRTTGYVLRLTALRVLEKALIERNDDGIPHVEKVDPHVLFRAIQIFQENNPRSAYHVAVQLKLIADLLVKFRLTAVPFIWKNPLKRPDEHNNRVGNKSEEARAAKLPSTETLQALARAFHEAVAPVDVVSTSIAALMMCSPDRINEVLRLPVNCENTFVHNGKEQYGLRWWPSKGAEPMVKPVISTMVETARTALERIRKHTEEARRIAIWYERNPGKLYLPRYLEHLRGNEYLSTPEICEVVGFATNSAACVWAKANKVRFIKEERPRNGIGRPGNLYRFDDIEKAVIKMLPDNFDIYDKSTGLKYSEALCIFPKNFFHVGKGNMHCMFEVISSNVINIQLGSSANHDKTSVFSRLGILDADGNPYKIRTHQFRHFLNTLAQKKNVDQLIIAMWSGRKDVRQNRSYDNRTPEEVLELMRQGDISNTNGELIEIIPNVPMTREQYMEMRYPTVHTTQFGFCVHDWSMIPCQKHRACLDCTEHKCIKGDMKKTARIRECLMDAEQQLARDEEALVEGYIGADRWLELNRKRVDRLRNLVEIFDNPDFPEGTVIELTVENEYSPIGMALNERQMLGDADGMMLGRAMALSAAAA